jgi:hypothetical protein
VLPSHLSVRKVGIHTNATWILVCEVLLDRRGGTASIPSQSHPNDGFETLHPTKQEADAPNCAVTLNLPLIIPYITGKTGHNHHGLP